MKTYTIDVPVSVTVRVNVTTDQQGLRVIEIADSYAVGTLEPILDDPTVVDWEIDPFREHLMVDIVDADKGGA